MPGRATRYKFGPIEIDPASGELWRSGSPLKLARQPFQVLAMIVTAAGQPVTRDDLRAAVWADGTVVEFDQGLNYCIRQIRIALGDDARTPVYIETLPKRGYRLIMPLETAGDAAESAKPRRRLSWRVAVAAVSVAGVLASSVWLAARPSAVPRDPTARRMFLEAEHLSTEWELPKINEAVEQYAQVTQAEPRFAPAWAGLANADILLAFLGPKPLVALRDGEKHARAALDLDAALPIAHAALGHSYWLQWRWAEADAELSRAARSGENPIAHQLYGLYLASVGRRAEAVWYGQHAVELAPTSGLVNSSLATIYLQTGDFALADAQARHTLDIERHFPLAFVTILRADVLMGRLEAAAKILQEARRVDPDNDVSVWEAYLDAHLGLTTQARQILTAKPSLKGSLGEAIAWHALGDVDATFAVIERGIGNHAPSLVWLSVAPELQDLHNTTRLAGCMARIRPS